MRNVSTRRNFVRMAPLAAGALLPLRGLPLLAEAAPAASTVPFKLFSANDMAGELAGVQANDGTKNLIATPGLSVTMAINAETKKSGKEYEAHATRDHVFQVLDGETIYEVGGTLKGARETKPGEFLAPECEGFTRVVLKKGDYLSVPRNTPHKRITEGKVSLLLISANSVI
jgi:mannose-6-phosphate isomerase-like protein (cupin superfamily)